MPLYKVFFAKHSESVWDHGNLFPGWIDLSLTSKGIEYAKKIGKSFVDCGIGFDVIYTSMLQPTRKTAEIIYEEYVKRNEIQTTTKPIIEDWRLNERHFGAVTGFTKIEMVKKYGMKKLDQWRTNFEEIPPEMEKKHQHFEEVQLNPKWDIDTLRDVMPAAESFKMTYLRVAEMWEEIISPSVQRNKRVLVVAHGTSLRALIKYLGKLSDRHSMTYRLPKEIPFYYEFDEEMRPAGDPVPVYMATQELIEKALERNESSVSL